VLSIAEKLSGIGKGQQALPYLDDVEKLLRPIAEQNKGASQDLQRVLKAKENILKNEKQPSEGLNAKNNTFCHLDFIS